MYLFLKKEINKYLFFFKFSDAPIDLKIKTHMICDLLNLSSIPCTDPAVYSNKQRQQKTESLSQSEQLKRVSFFSFLSKKKKIFRTFEFDY